MSNRVGVFIDVGNQYYCINKKWLGRKLNYEKYLDAAKVFGPVVRAFAYGTQVEGVAVNFITVLHHLGYEPQYKTVEKKVWYSWNVGMAMDIVRLVTNNKIDVVVMGNSDNNMVPVISWAREKGIKVIITGCGINKELKQVCDRWIEINEGMLELKAVPKKPVAIEEEEEEYEEFADTGGENGDTGTAK
ncbi:hypothetical protein LCGC14_2712150 [marine sediment metagenome]|uniref:NYN domain-containing protein n=1 Tax=marine sediment metagenome TaxID=412755 RepID=A0A0F8ZCK4_9ZZZZ